MWHSAAGRSGTWCRVCTLQDEVVSARAIDVVQVRLAVGDIRPGPPGPGQLDHRPGQVDGVDLLEPFGQGHRVSPGSASQVQRAAAGDGQDPGKPTSDPVVPDQFAQPVVVFGDTVERLSVCP